MYIVVIAISSVALIWALSVVSFQGLDIRKRSSWIYVAIGFLCGLALSTGISSNLTESLIMGAMVAVLVLFTGVTMLIINRNMGVWVLILWCENIEKKILHLYWQNL